MVTVAAVLLWATGAEHKLQAVLSEQKCMELVCPSNFYPTSGSLCAGYNRYHLGKECHVVPLFTAIEAGLRGYLG